MSEPSAPDLVLAVDGGQSSTLALAATHDGRILGAGLAGPSNHVHEPGGVERLENALRQSIEQALTSAGCSAERVTHVCLGMTGAAREAAEVTARIVPAARVTAEHDVVTALVGASVAQPGVIVIAGTGSIAYGRLADGRDARAGGWGYLMGDEGSAYAIGRAALQAASKAADGRGAPTSLLQAIPRRFGLRTLQDVREAVYSPVITRPHIARLSAVVASAAEEGDLVARSLLDEAGRELASTALAVIARLGMLDAGMTVYTTGGVFAAGPLVLDPFHETLGRRSPASAIREAAYSPVIGALLMALQAAGVVPDDSVIAAISTSLPEAAISKHKEKEAG